MTTCALCTCTTFITAPDLPVGWVECGCCGLARNLFFRDLDWTPEVFASHPDATEQVTAVLELAERLQVPKTILEIGPGRGDAIPVAEERGWTYLGVEHSPNALCFGKGNVIMAHFPYDHLHKLVLGSMGVILCLRTLEHIRPVREAFDRFGRYLAPGGLLFITTPDRDTANNAFLSEHHCAFRQSQLDLAAKRCLSIECNIPRRDPHELMGLWGKLA